MEQQVIRCSVGHILYDPNADDEPQSVALSGTIQITVTPGRTIWFCSECYLRSLMQMVAPLSDSMVQSLVAARLLTAVQGGQTELDFTPSTELLQVAPSRDHVFTPLHLDLEAVPWSERDNFTTVEKVDPTPGGGPPYALLIYKAFGHIETIPDLPHIGAVYEAAERATQRAFAAAFVVLDGKNDEVEDMGQEIFRYIEAGGSRWGR